MFSLLLKDLNFLLLFICVAVTVVSSCVPYYLCSSLAIFGPVFLSLSVLFLLWHVIATFLTPNLSTGVLIFIVAIMESNWNSYMEVFLTLIFIAHLWTSIVVFICAVTTMVILH